MTDQLEIIRVTSTDLELLQRISRDTFYETFAAFNTEADMQQYLKVNLGIERLEEEVNNPFSEFYFARLGNKIVGYLKLNVKSAQTVPEDLNALEIERIYVYKEFHGSSIGQKLFDFAMDHAHKINAPYVWLGVWEKNPRAIAFYLKNGFVEFGKHSFILGEDEQTDILMKIKL